jgi:hypothetical protein
MAVYRQLTIIKHAEAMTYGGGLFRGSPPRLAKRTIYKVAMGRFSYFTPDTKERSET